MLQKESDMAEETKIEDIMEHYMGKSCLRQEAFAQTLTESLVNTGVDRVSVSNWCNGKYWPKTDVLLAVVVAYTDWRKQWGIDCLIAKLPEVFARDEKGKITMLT
jgi:hypothetical protein